ncbi:PLC-like phosphodiesterase [Eremomyces bilateralis CBS 781.70]|uniref:glycerophosphodiester phosphodiesterase n=1 Tax=Eremomyces bilateralis CBS 781.70 TaxID=1392243 RepID=A0A6G1G2H9_9PEZI|nr:PLC-like phosphodiesterase [Eremomyces bilateralis CBS 781.70]KAF1812130.1 PLC-like phosphodiesterase [Eremomyces bilateralis CBS 781.70]
MRSVLIASLSIGFASASPWGRGGHNWNGHHGSNKLNVQVGDRPYYLVNDMDNGPLKEKLQSCSEGPFSATEFTIAHRGASLQFPEETFEAWTAAARQGAGVLECDVAFTQDKQLVCRHDQCDLHYTTNILATPLAAKCTTPFTPASGSTSASAKCCTSDITLAEFKSLCGKMEGQNVNATTVAEYIDGTPDFRTDVYATCGTVASHKEYIEFTDSLGLKFTPELKTPGVPMPFGTPDYTQAAYAQQLIDEYKAAGIDPKRVYPQSFLVDDVYYWIQHEPNYGKQAVYLTEPTIDPAGFDAAVANLTTYRENGVNIIAPSIAGLLALDAEGKIVPSSYAKESKRLGMEIITWSFDRSGPVATWEADEYYYSTVIPAMKKDGDLYTVLDVLARQVGVSKVFSDWPASVTYYANCFRL